MDYINAEPTQPQPGYVDPYSQAQALNLYNQKEYLDVLKHYTEDDTIPQKIKEQNWAIFSRSLPLTFLDEKDLPLIDIFSNIFRINELMNKPPHKIDFESTANFDQSTFHLWTQAKRAIGTAKNRMNERTLQVTQIGQSISTQTSVQQAPPRNVLTKLRGIM